MLNGVKTCVNSGLAGIRQHVVQDAHLQHAS